MPPPLLMPDLILIASLAEMGLIWDWGSQFGASLQNTLVKLLIIRLFRSNPIIVLWVFSYLEVWIKYWGGRGWNIEGIKYLWEVDIDGEVDKILMERWIKYWGDKILMGRWMKYWWVEDIVFCQTLLPGVSCVPIQLETSDPHRLDQNFSC